MNKTQVNVFCFITMVFAVLMFAVVALAAPVPDTGYLTVREYQE